METTTQKFAVTTHDSLEVFEADELQVLPLEQLEHVAGGDLGSTEMPTKGW
jgi:hypothetical protein